MDPIIIVRSLGRDHGAQCAAWRIAPRASHPAAPDVTDLVARFDAPGIDLVDEFWLAAIREWLDRGAPMDDDLAASPTACSVWLELPPLDEE